MPGPTRPWNLRSRWLWRRSAWARCCGVPSTRRVCVARVRTAVRGVTCPPRATLWAMLPTVRLAMPGTALSRCRVCGFLCSALATVPMPVSIHRQSRWLYGCWPLKGAFSQPSEAKARTKAKASYCCLHCRSTGNSRENILPEFSKFYCHPGRAGGSPIWIRRRSTPAVGWFSRIFKSHCADSAGNLRMTFRLRQFA